jgi:hypothetical protein
MPDLARAVADPVYKLAADNQAAANSSRDREINYIAQTASGPVPVFTERGSIGVVI